MYHLDFSDFHHMLSSGDIETNPGLTFSIKSVQKSYHPTPNIMLIRGLSVMCNS